MSSKQNYAVMERSSRTVGSNLAGLFARAHRDIVVVAGNEDKLEKLRGALEKDHGVRVSVMVRDLADPGSTQEVFRELDSEGVDVLVGVVPSSRTWMQFFRDFSYAVNRGLQAKVSC